MRSIKNKFLDIIVKRTTFIVFIRPFFYFRNHEYQQYIQQICIDTAAKILQKTLQDFDYKGGVIVSKEDILVEYKGVRLDTKYTNRYLKAKGSPNIAEEFIDFIQEVRKEKFNPRVVVDIGANVGEVSLFFSKIFPEAKIIAVECHPGNLKGLFRNLSLNIHNIAHKDVIKKAISDTNAKLFFSQKRSAKAKICATSTSETIEVESITLKDLMYTYNEPYIDFLKIDIEGAEILLLESLTTLIGRIGIAVIEMSKDTDKKIQSLIFQLFLNNNFKIYYKNTLGITTELTSIQNIEKILKNNVTMDFFFVSQHE